MLPVSETRWRGINHSEFFPQRERAEQSELKTLVFSVVSRAEFVDFAVERAVLRLELESFTVAQAHDLRDVQSALRVNFDLGLDGEL